MELFPMLSIQLYSEPIHDKYSFEIILQYAESDSLQMRCCIVTLTHIQNERSAHLLYYLYSDTTKQFHFKIFTIKIIIIICTWLNINVKV